MHPAYIRRLAVPGRSPVTADCPATETRGGYMGARATPRAPRRWPNGALRPAARLRLHLAQSEHRTQACE